jgi:chemotaxis methyl-accepting protein methylase
LHLSPSSTGHGVKEQMDSVQALLEQIRHERGIDLGSYKLSFLQRRLAMRLRARGCPDYTAYRQLLRHDPAEYGPLLDALTINLTRFFRDATAFQAIEEKLLPELLRRLRVWSAGCAAGEEAYSLAIILRECLGADLPRWRLEILATDLDGKALDKARQSLYDAFSFQGLAPRYQHWIDRYFTSGPQRQLAAEVRGMVTFQQHDLIQDPPPPDLDLILCRNVLIYFDRPQQDRLYPAFHRALRADGFLVLGKAEIMPLAWSRHFVPLDRREHIYRRIDPPPSQSLIPGVVQDRLSGGQP